MQEVFEKAGYSRHSKWGAVFPARRTDVITPSFWRHFQFIGLLYRLHSNVYRRAYDDGVGEWRGQSARCSFGNAPPPICSRGRVCDEVLDARCTTGGVRTPALHRRNFRTGKSLNLEPPTWVT